MRRATGTRSTAKAGAAIESDESLQRQLIAKTVAMFYTLRALPARKQLLCELEALQRSAWTSLRLVEVRRLRAISVLSHEYIAREELVEQFLFERELLLEPQFVVLEEFTRGDIILQEASNRRLLEEFIAEACTMWIRSNWKVGDPEEVGTPGGGETLAQGGHDRSHQIHRPKREMASPALSQRTSPTATAEASVLDSFFVPSAPPPDRRGWRPASATKQTPTSPHQRRTSPSTQPTQLTPPKHSPIRMRPSTASIYRHQDKLFVTPAATTKDLRQWSSPRAASLKDGASPPATAPQRRPQSAKGHVVIKHFVPKPRGENHREQPYFTSHYCSPSPPSTSRPLSANSGRGSCRPNHGAPLLMLTGKHASIAQTKEMLKHMSLEEVERLVPMIRMPRLDLSYSASPRALAAREARRLFDADSSPGGLHNANRHGSCPYHGSAEQQEQQNPPMAFLSFSRPYPNSALVALPLENLAATLRAMQLHHLSNVPPYAINFLKEELGTGGTRDGGGCPWCEGKEASTSRQRPDGAAEHLPLVASRRRASSSIALSLPTVVSPEAQGRPPRPFSATPTAYGKRHDAPPHGTPPQPVAAHGPSPVPTYEGDSNASRSLDPSLRRSTSLREQLLFEFPFLKTLDRQEDLFNLRLEFLDPLSDAEFARWAYEWKECVAARGGRQGLPVHQQRSQLEARMLDRCVALAREYQRQALLVEYPFLPDAVNGVELEHLNLQHDPSFRRAADAVVAAQQASRVPSSITAHYALAGSTLATATERLHTYLEDNARAFQHRTLSQVCPYVFVQPPESAAGAEWPRDEAALAPQWSFFRMCFALYVCPPHTIGLWTDAAFLDLLRRVRKARSSASNASDHGGAPKHNTGDAASLEELERQVFKLVLLRAQAYRRNIFRDAGLQGKVHSWSVDELEPYLHIALSPTIPAHVDAFAILRKHAASTPGGIASLFSSPRMARMQYLLLVDWCPFLSRKRRGEAVLDAATATKAQLLHQATRDVMNASDGFGTDVSEAEYQATLPHVDFFGDATFMAACNTWMDYMREDGWLEDASAAMRSLEAKMCGRAATLARFWLEHEALTLATQREELENAQQRWHAATDKRQAVALCEKRCAVLHMEEPLYRALVVMQCRHQRRALMAEAYQEVTRCMLDVSLRAKEQRFFIAVALEKRVEFTRNVVVPTMERMGRAFQGQHHKLQLNATDRLRLEDEENTTRHDIEWEDQMFWRAVVEQERTDRRVSQLLERRRETVVEPLMAAEANQRNDVVGMEAVMWRQFSQDASRTLTRIQSHRVAVQQFLLREETARLHWSKHFMQALTVLHQDADSVLAREAAKLRRRASLQFHHAQAEARRLGAVHHAALGASERDDAVVPLRASFRGRPLKTQSIVPTHGDVAQHESHSRGATTTEEEDAWTALRGGFRASGAFVDVAEQMSDDEQLARARVAKNEAQQRDELKVRMEENTKLKTQQLRDAQLIASSVPFHSIFGFQDVDEWIETTDADVAAAAIAAQVPPPPLSSMDAMRRYYAATTSGGAQGPPTILRATTSPSPSHSKRVRIADGA